MFFVEISQRINDEICYSSLGAFFYWFIRNTNAFHSSSFSWQWRGDDLTSRRDVGYLFVEWSRIATLWNNHLPSIEQDRVAERAEAKLRTKCARSGAILFNSFLYDMFSFLVQKRVVYATYFHFWWYFFSWLYQLYYIN